MIKCSDYHTLLSMCTRTVTERRIPFYNSCVHMEPAVDSQKPPDILNSKDAHSLHLDSRSICKQRQHTVIQCQSNSDSKIIVKILHQSKHRWALQMKVSLVHRGNISQLYSNILRQIPYL